MQRWIEPYDKVLEFSSRQAFIFAAILGALIVLGNGYEVIARYAFNEPTGFMEQILIYANTILIWLALGWAWRTKSHVNVELVVDRLKGRWHRGVTLWAMFIVFITLVGLCWSVWSYEIDLIVDWRKPDTVLKTPWAIPHGLVALGISLFGLETLLSLVKEIKSKFFSSKNGATLSESEIGEEE